MECSVKCISNLTKCRRFPSSDISPYPHCLFYIRWQNSGLLGKGRYLWQDTWAAFYRLNNATRILLFANFCIKRIHWVEIKIASPRNDLTSSAVLGEGNSMVAPIFLVPVSMSSSKMTCPRIWRETMGMALYFEWPSGRMKVVFSLRWGVAHYQ